jgi:hypothetical protein
METKRRELKTLAIALLVGLVGGLWPGFGPWMSEQMAHRAFADSKGRSKRDLMAGDSLSFIGQLGDGGRLCEEERQGKVAHLHLSTRRYPFGGCCIEYLNPITISTGERIKLSLRADAEEKDVEVKVEAGTHGSPSETAWLYKGRIEGNADKEINSVLKEDPRTGVPLTKPFVASRLCFAVLGEGQEPADVRLTRAKIVPSR